MQGGGAPCNIMDGRPSIQLNMPSEKTVFLVCVSNYKYDALGKNFEQVKSWLGLKMIKGSPGLSGTTLHYLTVGWLKYRHPDGERK
jgi:hypothetical protein